jgi:hypothetical protein
MAEQWEDRVRSIAGALLTLEVNTIEKANMSASKMPEVPLALHELVQLYEAELAARGFYVTDALLDAALARLAKPDDPATRQTLDAWPFTPHDKASDNLTNGPKTFEALAWAALAAKRQLGEMPAQPASNDVAMLAAATDRALMQRILTNCRQLRQVTLLLTQQFPAPPAGVSLFDGTVEQTTAVMFKHPRPALTIETDVLMLIRKAWDIGVETVLFQTAMQVDGDVLLRVTPGLEVDRRAFFSELHRSTVETGIRQWQSLFQLAAGLLSGVGQALFRRG